MTAVKNSELGYDRFGEGKILSGLRFDFRKSRAIERQLPRHNEIDVVPKHCRTFLKSGSR
jgi:hypothetical protein